MICESILPEPPPIHKGVQHQNINVPLLKPEEFPSPTDLELIRSKLGEIEEYLLYGSSGQICVGQEHGLQLEISF